MFNKKAAGGPDKGQTKLPFAPLPKADAAKPQQPEQRSLPWPAKVGGAGSRTGVSHRCAPPVLGPRAEPEHAAGGVLFQRRFVVFQVIRIGKRRRERLGQCLKAGRRRQEAKVHR